METTATTTEGPSTILAVDDDTRILESVSDILGEAGYRVVTAGNGRQALDCLEQHRPQLILSDIHMPEMDGFALHHAVQRDDRFRYLPFIFLSGLDTREDVRRGQSMGADDYLTKPFRPDDLVTAVEARLKRIAELRRGSAHQLDLFRDNILSNLTSNLTHEFRTPITVMQSFTSLILDGYAGNEADLHEFLDVIRVSGDRLARLVENFLSLVMLNSGQAAEEFRAGRCEVEISSMVRLALEQLTQRPETAEVELVSRIEPGAMWALTHQEMMLRALGELLDNALKFRAPLDGRIEVSLRREAGRLVVEVSDNGSGLPEEEWERVFGEMYQFDRERQEQQGAGLGLTIARGYARLGGGDVRFLECDTGTRVRLSLTEISPTYKK
jgi:signal transduction histidine kinase